MSRARDSRSDRAPRLSFHGAARGVTGSCYRLETAGGTVLIDCGMFQGSKSEKELNYRPFPFEPSRVDAVLLTHAHIDHSGLLPKLVRAGFAGPIHATPATVDLCSVMLPDSAHIQQIEVEHLNRRRARWTPGPLSPIYDQTDVERTMAQMQGHDYGAWIRVLPDLRARLWNAGHLLGSASIELEIERPAPDAPLRVVFSGDIGPAAKLLQPPPDGPTGVDYAICESTYGDTDRPATTPEARRRMLGDEVRAAIHPEGALLIPSFAVERTQELVADLARLMADGDLPEIPIYIDSPLATRATEIFRRHSEALTDGAAFARALERRNIRFTQDIAESKALDELRGFHIVIAASGMAEAGRIRHRLKRWLSSPAATVLFVGFQAQGTLGRLLLDGADSVRIQGQAYDVRARIRAIDLYSGHADAPELAAWITARMPIRAGLFLSHGEPPALDALAARVGAAHPRLPLFRPALDDTVELRPSGARRAPDAPPPRIDPAKIANLDWHNDVSKLFLEINDALHAAADDRARQALIRRIRRALSD